MIRRTKPLAALVLAATAFTIASPAHAGGGVRMNFGGPLGTFVATPTPGYGGGGGYSAPRKAAPKTHTAKRSSPAPVAAAERRKPKTARHVIPVRHTVTEEKPKTAPVTANVSEDRGFLSRTLVNDSLPRAETVRAVLPTDTIVAKEVVETETASIAPAKEVKTAPKTTAKAGPATCRKFIPAVGVTVTVACD